MLMYYYSVLHGLFEGIATTCANVVLQCTPLEGIATTCANVVLQCTPWTIRRYCYYVC